MSRYRDAARVRRLFMATMAVMCVLVGPVAANAVAAPPVNNLAPEVTGNAALGEQLVCGSGSWSGAVSSFEYEWVRDGLPIASGLIYTLAKADEGHEVWCIVTAVGSEGRATAESSNSVRFGTQTPPEEPKNTSPPEVTGNPAVGQTLTCSEGTWSGNPTPTLTYKWLRDTEAIPSATNSTHTVIGDDAGHSLSCKVTATNTAGEASQVSKNSLAIPATAPHNTKAPAVLGNPQVSETLTCNEGTWEGSPLITFKFQWLREGTAIPTATFSTYVVERADEGKSLACRVTAKNTAGEAVAASAARMVGTGKPENTEPPTISGVATVGSTLSCSPGMWTGSPTYEYQWVRDRTEAILGASSSEYQVVSADRGHSLYCDVTAKNGVGQASRLSAPFPIPSGSGSGAPKNTGKPVVSGSAAVSQTLECSPGTWNPSATSPYSYQWVRDRGLAGETSIETGTKETYMVTTADQGHSLTCVVTALNGEGKGEAASEPLPVPGSLPSSLSTPLIYGASGTPHVGESLSCLHGEWEGAPPPTFTYQWIQDGTIPIAGASEASYTIATTDRGHSLSCNVTAKNSEGEATASSKPLKVPGTIPENTNAPNVSGEPKVGSTLTCSEGTWSGQPAPTFSYQWLLNGVPIPSATTHEYTVGSAGRGLTITCRVTATSSEGTASTSSKGVHVPGVKPEDLEAPLISGNASVGQTVTCVRGVWNAKPPPVFTYQWLRDGAPIGSATASTYTIEPADQGHLLSCVVTATNSEGSVEVESSNGLPIASRLTQSKVETPFTLHPFRPTQPTAAEILAALNRQLTAALRRAHIKSLLKAGSYTFSFTPPTAGALELQGYEVARSAHGSAKGKQLVVMQSNTSFARAAKSSMKLRLTAMGRRGIKGKKRVSLTFKAIFRVSHGISVTWQKTFVLSR